MKTKLPKTKCKTCLGEAWFHDNCNADCSNRSCEKCPDCNEFGTKPKGEHR